MVLYPKDKPSITDLIICEIFFISIGKSHRIPYNALIEEFYSPYATALLIDKTILNVDEICQNLTSQVY